MPTGPRISEIPFTRDARSIARPDKSDFIRSLVVNAATGASMGALIIATILMADAGGIATLISSSTTSLLSATLFITKGTALCVAVFVLVSMLAANLRVRS